MNHLHTCLLALSAALVAGCASGPESVDTTTSPATLDSAAPAPSATPSGAAVADAADAAVATGSAEATADAADGAEATQALVVDANQVAATTPEIICREMLRPNSNVITRYCGTAAAWKQYEEAQSRQAQELVRMFQGGRYR